MALPPVRRLILLVIIVALLFWQRSAVTSWANNIASKVGQLFGWGLVLIIIALGTLVWVIWRRKLSSLIYHWNQWLGGVAFILAAWGILALFNLGGSFGLAIIGQEDFIAILWILGFVIIGTILVAPKACFRLAVSFFSWPGKQFKRRMAPRPTPQQEPSFPTVPAAPNPPEIEPEKETVTPVLTPTQAQQELKQVAQEVWRKYGESPDLITIDGWRLPPIDILDRAPEVEFSQADNIQRAKLLEEALASYGVEAKVVQINAGPTVTQFGLEPGWDRKMREIKERDRDGSVKVRLEEVSKTRVKVERITSLANDLALALVAPSIRIEAPVPGKSVVGIEVPNTISSLVSLRG